MSRRAAGLERDLVPRQRARGRRSSRVEPPAGSQRIGGEPVPSRGLHKITRLDRALGNLRCRSNSSASRLSRPNPVSERNDVREQPDSGVVSPGKQELARHLRQRAAPSVAGSRSSPSGEESQRPANATEGGTVSRPWPRAREKTGGYGWERWTRRSSANREQARPSAEESAGAHAACCVGDLRARRQWSRSASSESESGLGSGGPESPASRLSRPNPDANATMSVSDRISGVVRRVSKTPEGENLAFSPSDQIRRKRRLYTRLGDPQQARSPIQHPRHGTWRPNP